MLSRYVVSQVKHNSYFLVGVALGLWVSLMLVPMEEEAGCAPELPAAASAPPDLFEPRREQRPLGPAGQPAPARPLQRPRYYSTELGMRASLLAGVLSSEEMLESRAAAINKTAAGLQPGLRFFITASSVQAKGGRANVVGFTDSREMLKPFHALKYLADNYLEEYNFFFLVGDTSYVNARRLQQLVARLSVSQHVYMGRPADDDPHYCTLEGGILLSSSVLRAVHAELDWCVRNSYSPRHHENVGRCVLHAAHLPCAPALHARAYTAARLPPDGPARLHPTLARAITVHPLHDAAHFHRLHAYVARVHLERTQRALAAQRAAAAASFRRHPRGYRNATWPAALRADAGLAPPPPPTRFDHLRWTRFNATHAFLPDDSTAVAPLRGANERAVRLVVDESLAWARTRWGAAEARLVEGAWCWEPPHALRYRLVVRLRAPDHTFVRQLEAVRPLGAARLAPARYVTESTRVTLAVGCAEPAAALAFLRRYESACLERDENAALVLSLAGAGPWADVHEAARAAAERHRGARLDLIEGEAPPAGAGEPETQQWTTRIALEAAAARGSGDALLLALPHDSEFSEEFLNRVRMNTIAGEQWFLASAFRRYAVSAHPRFVEPDGSRPQTGTGRFARVPLALAVYRSDYKAARSAWAASGGAPDASPAEVLAAGALRCLHAPEPALVRPPGGPPCRNASCLAAERAAGFRRLELGARHSLAKLLLHELHDREYNLTPN